MQFFLLNTGSNGSVMPIRVYTMLFLQNIESNKSVNKKKVLHTYTMSSIPQMGICHIAIIKKGIKYKCSLFVVPGN